MSENQPAPAGDEDVRPRPVHGFDDVCAVPCPQCGVPGGVPCLRVRWPHVRRTTAALRAAGWTRRDEATWQQARADRFEAERLARLEQWRRDHPDGDYLRQHGKWCRSLSSDAPPSWWCMDWIGSQWFVMHVYQRRYGGLYRWRIMDPTGQFDWAQGWALRPDSAQRRARRAAEWHAECERAR